MAENLEKKVAAFLSCADVSDSAICLALTRFFQHKGTERYAVVNGNLSLFENGALSRIINLPTARNDNFSAFMFDGTGISIVNSSEQPNKKRSTGSSSTNNNNNNNNNNNG